MKFLRVAIPTYNRSSDLMNQLKFISCELTENLSKNVEIFVYDNCSTDNTFEVINHYLNERKWFTYVRNDNNLGLVGNVDKILTQSSSKFTWIISDDDLLEKGILDLVYNSLYFNNNVSWAFINHDAFVANQKNIVLKSAVNFSGGIFQDGKEAITKIFLHSRTTPMFISACVFKTTVLQNYINYKSEITLADPLCYSFYSASKGDVYIFDKILIHNSWGATSWESESKNVMYRDVFNILFMLSNFGYSKKQIKLMVKENLKFNFIYQIKGLFRLNYLSFKLLKYYNFKLLYFALLTFFKHFKLKSNF